MRRVYRQQRQFGVDLPRALSSTLAYVQTRRQRKEFFSQAGASVFGSDFPRGPSYLTFGDASSPGGNARGHYFHQDLLVAREVYRRRPRRHIDVGSSVEGFVGHVASFRDVDVIDIRRIESDVSGITFHQLDITNADGDWEAVGTADSVSCLHALEHFGLGRYGDAIDFDGWSKGLAGLKRLMEPGGRLYLSVPTGARQRVEFNAHRVFSVPFLENVLSGHFVVHDFSFVDDEGDLHQSISLRAPEARHSFYADYGCSIWTLGLT